MKQAPVLFLVRVGVSFRNHYIISGTWGVVCVPSRNMMLTGRTSFHITAPDQPSLATDKGSVIPPDHVMLTEQFGKQDYRTFMGCKWHNVGAISSTFAVFGRVGQRKAGPPE